MNAAESVKVKLSQISGKVLFILILILITLEIILFVFIKTGDTQEIDIETTEYLQESLFNMTNNSINYILEINHYLNDIYTPHLLISIIYCFFTVYDCFILVNILSVNYIFSFIIKLIYNKPSYKIFDTNNNIQIYYCGYGYAFPSEEIIIAVSFYLSIWKITNKLSFKYNKKEKVIKYIFFTFILVLLLYYNFCTLLTGYYFISHIIFSTILGIIVYLIFLESNFFNLLNGNEFIKFLRRYKLLYIIINLSFFVIFSVIYMVMRASLSKDNKYKNCWDNKGSEFNKNEDYYSYLDGTFVFNVLFLANVFSILGIMLELRCIHKGDESSFYQSNFPSELNELINPQNIGSFTGSIHITQETVWNNTSLLVSILRLIFVLVFCWFCFFPYMFIHLNDEHITLVIFIKMFLPPSVFFMGIFFYLKPLLKLMRLTNLTLQSMSMDI